MQLSWNFWIFKRNRMLLTWWGRRRSTSNIQQDTLTRKLGSSDRFHSISNRYQSTSVHGYILKHDEGQIPLKMWTKGVLVDDKALNQLKQMSKMPIIHHHIAVMPDVHWGIGATVGSVIPFVDAVIPSAVGVDIGCGMIASKTTLRYKDLPESLKKIRQGLENRIPVGRTDNGGPLDLGSWRSGKIPSDVKSIWRRELKPEYDSIVSKHKALRKANDVNHLGTLGTGNHFIEMCVDEDEYIWLMLHSGSRGIGNKIGTYFIELAKQDMRVHLKNLPDKDLAYLKEGTKYFDDYIEAVYWAQKYAQWNRRIMMSIFLDVLRDPKYRLPSFESDVMAVNCHHNYVQKEFHFGQDVYLTRKGAVSAKRGQLGIIPGSMGAKSFIVEGLGNEDSFHTCSHGAGRAVSRTDAKKLFTLDQHIQLTEGVECRKDKGVLDETPLAYKNIDDVMEAQKDLVKVRHVLKQILCVKG